MCDEEYISRKEALKILGLFDSTFLKFEKKYKLEFRWAANHSKEYKKEDILFFKDQQNQIGKRYVPASQAKEMFKDYVDENNMYIWTKKIKTIAPPLFCLNKDILNRNERLCDVEEVREILEKWKLKQDVNDVSSNNITDTFSLRLSMYEGEIPILNQSQYTKNKWIQYVNFKLLNTKNNESLLEERISLFLKITFMIEEKMNEIYAKEIYGMTSNQINMWLIGIRKKIYRQYIYEFFKAINEDIQVHLKTLPGIQKGFIFSRIIKYNDPRFMRIKEKNAENIAAVYDADTYIALFKYLIDIKLHVGKIVKTEMDVAYLSTWLYCLLHLNNGWRRGDIVSFPRLRLKDILDEWNVTDANWFLKNEINSEKSRKIISRIIQFDFMVAKTELKNHFFCSDRLAPSIATALLLFEYYYSNTNALVCSEYNQPVMQFKGRKNIPSSTMLKKLFDEFTVKDFVFASKKMNKTILTLIYDVACTISPSGYNDLILPQYLRAHKSESSTIHYIEFSQSQLEFLSGELFERGSFGFVADTLLNYISQNKDSSGRTKEIAYINNIFGDHNKIEATAGMLNHFADGEHDVVDVIEQYGVDRCVDVMMDIYLDNLPSKESHIQCLYSKDKCRNPDSECLSCKYSIPNIYVLYSLGNKIVEEMKEYELSKMPYMRLKLSSQIHKQTNILMQAIRRYGKEYVYNCMDVDRNEFIRQFGKIAEVKELVKLT